MIEVIGQQRVVHSESLRYLAHRQLRAWAVSPNSSNSACNSRSRPSPTGDLTLPPLTGSPLLSTVPHIEFTSV